GCAVHPRPAVEGAARRAAHRRLPGLDRGAGEEGAGEAEGAIAMVREHNPQAEQMGDESMARNLAFQAEAIWPQERALFARYGLSGALRVLDLGCGTGEITRRLAALYPQAQL